MCVVLVNPSSHFGICFSVLISENKIEVHATVEAYIQEILSLGISVKCSQVESSIEYIHWLFTSH